MRRWRHVLVWAAVAAPGVGRATVRVVNPSGAWPTIGSAVAASAAGDVVQLPAGAWDEAVTVAVDLTFEGAGPSATEWTAASTVLTVAGARVTVRDLALRPGSGRALAAEGATVVLEGVDVAHGTIEGDGAGLWVRGSTVTLTDVDLWDLTARGGRGGCVYAEASTVVASGGSFDRCTARDGGAVYAVDSTVRVEGVAFTNGTAVDEAAAGRGGAIRVEGVAGRASLAIEDSTFLLGFASGTGGFVDADHADVRVHGATFLQGQAALGGGALCVRDGTLYAADTTFYHGATFAPSGGGAAIAVDGVTVEVVGGTFAANHGDLGGAIRAVDSKVTLTASTLRDNDAFLGGAVYHEGAKDLVISGTLFEDNDATYAGAVSFTGTWGSPRLEVRTSAFSGNEAVFYAGAVDVAGAGLVVLDDSVFDGNVAEGGGAVQIADTARVTSTRASFCGNRAERDAGGAVWTSDTGSQEWRSTVFVDNLAAAGGAAIHVDGQPAMTIDHAHVLGSRGPAALDLGEATGAVTASLVAWSAGAGLQVDGWGHGWNLDHDAWWANDGGDTALPLGVGTVQRDPGLTDWPTTSGCGGAALWPTWTSPLRNAGDPATTDPDGSRADIGAYGGAAADPAVWTDDDADGVAVAWDCDDNAASVHPGAAETPYDGVDQDCDGADLCDLDGDGVAALACGGGDCDDGDPATWPGAAEVRGDGVDQDCDGRDPRDPGGYGGPVLTGAGCGCDGGGGGAPPWAALLAALTLGWRGRCSRGGPWPANERSHP